MPAVNRSRRRHWWVGLAMLVASACSSGDDPAPSPGGSRAGASGADSGAAPTPTGADPRPSPAVFALLRQAGEAADAQRFDEALGLLDQVLEGQPGQREALKIKGAILHFQAAELAGKKRSGDALYLEAARTLRGMRDGKTPLDAQERQLLLQALLDEAAVHSRAGAFDKALATLEESMPVGLREVPEVLEEIQFSSLRRRPEYASFRDRLGREADVYAREKVQRLLAGNTPFPFDFTLKGLDGKTVSLDDLRGKVTIVDFWGTWCPPCREEVPHFIKLKEKYGERGLSIVGLNYENGSPSEAVETIRQFVGVHKINYPCLLGDDSTRQQVPDFDGFPTTLFLDAEGIVHARLTGYHSLRDLDALVVALLDRQENPPVSGTEASDDAEAATRDGGE